MTRKADYDGYQLDTVNRTRKVALFEGTDEFGRLQPLLGTAEPATDYLDNAIYWPNTPAYVNAGLIGQMEGAIAWHSPTTENPNLGDTEIGRSSTSPVTRIPFTCTSSISRSLDERRSSGTATRTRTDYPRTDLDPAEDGTYLEEQPVVQHNGVLGSGFKVVTATYEEGPYTIQVTSTWTPHRQRTWLRRGPARSRSSRPSSTNPAATSGTATSSRTKTMR